ncbi:ABC transporter ATP-binding protein [Nocardioides sp. TRM66260-LWL]|uniref:ABC transporter ATP-binding protein n=1 Tax=Nocardioides sp. TRM66260-LWL TaxID=2874478 RepID=UPI001CC35CEA|nr:ABC transporter ATP-binding protein [Nocardioides sp. TRM66260-LWL]MBZ5732973.1 ABC transporter ATP-binding protein [Nocardioides sp. TRM66260-LWL]
MTTLVLEHVSRSFGPVRAVDDVSLAVPPGSVTALLGPSGCGKTTLLRVIAGFLEPDAGSVALDGRVVAAPGRCVPARDRGIGYVPQEGALFPHLDVAANIAFGLRGRAGRGRRERVARVAELLDLVELPRTFAERAPHELSGGQQQRVALARALAPAPSVVLLDEPFSSLDAALRASTGEAVVAALRAAGATGVLVTHDQDEALSLTDQVAVMRAGRLVQAAAPRELYARPADADVARFVGGAVVLPARARAGRATCALGDVALVSEADEAALEGEVTLVLRPEQLRLTPERAATHGGALARVIDVGFHGHDATVRLALLDDADVRLLARTDGLTAPEPGAQVRVDVVGPASAHPR